MNILNQRRFYVFLLRYLICGTLKLSLLHGMILVSDVQFVLNDASIVFLLRL